MQHPRIKTKYNSTENLYFRILAEFILGHRWLVLFACCLISGFMIHQIAKNLQIDNGTETFVGDESEEVAVLEELYDDFGQDRIYQIVVAGDVFSMPYLERLRSLHDDMAAIDLDIESLGHRKGFSKEKAVKRRDNVQAKGSLASDKYIFEKASMKGFDSFNATDGMSKEAFSGFEGDLGWGEEDGGTIFDEVVSLLNVRETKWESGGLKVSGLLDNWPTSADLPALKEKVLNDESLVGRVIGRDGLHSVLILRTDFMDERDELELSEHIFSLAKKHNTEGFKVMVSGHPAFNAALDSMMLSDLRILTLVATVVMIMLSYVIFRHPLGVLGPLLVVVQSAIWTLGVMAMTDTPMTIVTNVLPAFLACVGVGDSVHIQSVYRDARARGLKNYEAIVHAVATTGIPVLYTTITTGLGLLSFKFATLGAIEDMGIFGAFGIMSALFLSLIFLPVLLSFNRKSLLGIKQNQSKRDRLDVFLDFCNNLSRAHLIEGRRSHRRPYLILTLSLFLVLIFGLGALLLTTYHDPLSWIPPDREIRKSMEEMDANVGGTASIALLINAKNGESIKDRDLLLRLEALERYIRKYEDPNSGDKEIVGVTTSLLDVIKESWRAVNGEKEAFYAIPKTERGLGDMITLFENAAPEQLKRLATVDMMNTLMTVRVKWLEAGAYKPLTEYVDKGVKKFIGDRAVVKITGSVRMVFMVISSLLSDLIKSFGMAFITVTIVMIFLLRGIKLGIISMVPNLMPVVMVMGIMGFASIPLDMANLIIASIIIGIAVDDTIHFLHQFRIHYSEYGDVDAAIDHAFSHTGRAMAATSFMLVIGFCVFLSASIYPLQRFGILTGMTIVFAFAFDVVVGPALLRVLYKSKNRETVTLTKGQ